MSFGASVRGKSERSAAYGKSDEGGTASSVSALAPLPVTSSSVSAR